MEISGTQAEWIRLCFGSSLSRLLRPKVRSDVGSGRRGRAAETPSRIAFLRHPRVARKGTRSVSRGRAAGRPTERAKKADFEGGLWWGGPSGKQLLLTVCPRSKSPLLLRLRTPRELLAPRRDGVGDRRRCRSGASTPLPCQVGSRLHAIQRRTPIAGVSFASACLTRRARGIRTGRPHFYPRFKSLKETDLSGRWLCWHLVGNWNRL